MEELPFKIDQLNNAASGANFIGFKGPPVLLGSLNEFLEKV